MISSTIRDLPEHRQQVKDACVTQGIFPIMMEQLPASDAGAVAASLKMVDEADAYLGIFGWRYGFVPAGCDISITEMEYNRATERGIPRLIFLMHEDHPVKGNDVETGAGAIKLEALKQRLEATHVVNSFISAEDLRAKVINTLASLKTEGSGNGVTPPSDRIEPEESSVDILHKAPHYETIGRSQLLRNLDRYMFPTLHSKHAFVMLYGPYGIGKTAIAAEYVHRIGPKLSDFSTLWVDVRYRHMKWPELTERLIAELDPTPGVPRTLDHLTALLSNRSTLLVFDGIDWQAPVAGRVLPPDLRDFLGLLRPNMRSRVIVTAWKKTGLSGEYAIAVPSLPAHDVEKLLSRRMGKPAAKYSAADLNALDRIARASDGLPAWVEQIAAIGQEMPLEGLAELVSQFSIEHVPALELNPMRDAIQVNYSRLSGPARSLLERVALLGSVVSSTDVAYMAEAVLPLKDEAQLRYEISQRNLWSYDSDLKTYRIYSLILNYVRSQSATDMPEMIELRRVAGERLLERNAQVPTLLLEGLELLYSAGAWKSVLTFARKRFAVSENTDIFPSQDTDLLKARASWAIASVGYRLGDSRRAIEYAEQGMTALYGDASLKAKAIRIRLLTVLGYEYIQTRRIDDAEPFLNGADETVRNLTPAEAGVLQSEIAQVWLLLGQYEAKRSNGNLKDAWTHTQKAAEIFAAREDTIYYLKSLSNLGTILFYRGQQEESLTYSKKVLAESEMIESTDTALVAIEYCNIVDSYTEVQDWENALVYAEKGANYCRAHEEIGPYILLELNAVAVDYARGDLDQLRARLDQAAEYRHVVAGQRIYEAMFGAGWARLAFLSAKQTRHKAQRAKYLAEARKHIQQIRELPGAQSDAPVQGILNTLDAITLEL